MKPQKPLDRDGLFTPLSNSTASNDAEKNSESETNNSFHSVQRKAKLPASTGLSEAALLRCADSNEVLMYAKVFAQIFDSSIADDYQLRHFFMDLLVLADLNGVVDMTQSAIAARTRMPLDTVKDLLAKLEAPDPESRTTTAQGARIAKLDEHRSWGWFIVNYDKFRKTASEEQRREKTKERTKKWRSGDAPVTPGDAGDAMQRQNQMQTQKEKQIPNTELQTRINGWFKRRESTPWSPKELKALREIESQKHPEEDIALLEAYYTSGYQYLRRDIQTLLNNWASEIDRARNWKVTPKQEAPHAPQVPLGIQLKAVESQISEHRANPNGRRFMSNCSQADRDTLKALRERQKALQVQLGGA